MKKKDKTPVPSAASHEGVAVPTAADVEALKDRVDREHELRCGLERRWDHRISEPQRVAVIDRALALTGRTADVHKLTTEDMEAIGALVGLAQMLDAERAEAVASLPAVAMAAARGAVQAVKGGGA